MNIDEAEEEIECLCLEIERLKAERDKALADLGDVKIALIKYGVLDEGDDVAQVVGQQAELAEERDAKQTELYETHNRKRRVEEKLAAAEALLARRPHLADIDANGTCMAYVVDANYWYWAHQESVCARLGGACAK